MVGMLTERRDTNKQTNVLPSARNLQIGTGTVALPANLQLLGPPFFSISDVGFKF